MSPGEYEQLVQFLGVRFEAIDQRFAAIDRRFEAIERRFETIDHRFAAIDRRFDAIEQRHDMFRGEVLGHFDEIYRRLGRLDDEYHVITLALRRIEGTSTN